MNDYEFFESLGARHPVTVFLTVAQAEQRERRGIPLPISGDPESDHAKELLRILQERRTKVVTEAAGPTFTSRQLPSEEIAEGVVVEMLKLQAQEKFNRRKPGALYPMVFQFFGLAILFLGALVWTLGGPLAALVVGLSLGCSCVLVGCLTGRSRWAQ